MEVHTQKAGIISKTMELEKGVGHRHSWWAGEGDYRKYSHRVRATAQLSEKSQAML